MRPNATSEVAKHLRKILQDDGPEAFGRELVSVIVDDTLFHLLDAIDNGWKLGYTTSEGKSLDLCTEGMSELAGWYVSDDGWRDRYSKERALSFSGSDGDS